MLGRVAAVVIASLAALPALAQCNFTPVRSAQFRSSALDLAIDGTDVWVATSYGVSLYDRRVDPPKLVSSVAVPGITRVVRALNGIAYAGSGTSIAVVQKSGPHSLTVAHLIDAGGTINDMQINSLSIYAATSSGIAQFSLANPLIPTRTAATFTTSRPFVSSLALIDSSLYAADGDSSIEVFDLNGQRIGALTAPVGINFVRSNNGKLYASSGALATYVFTGSGASMTNAGSGAFGTASVAPIAGDVAFMAGADRRLHAVDFSVTGSPVDVFRADLSPTNGTTNRIAALATASNRLYIAAGDIGLVTYDITTFTAPFVIRAYATGGGSTIVSLVDKVYLARDSGGITEFSQSSNGALTQQRAWDVSRPDAVWDGAAGFLLSSSGSSMTLWTLQSTPPQPIGTATFRAPVVSAVLAGVVGFAVLSDGSLWSADFAQATPAPKQLLADHTALSAIARSGSSIVVEQINSDGTTTLLDFSTSDLTQQPRSAIVPGVAITGVTLSGSTAAVLTFRGISLVDFASGTTSVLPQSVTIAKSLVLTGTTLYELTDTSLIVWDTQKQTVVKQYTVPADPNAVHVAPTSTIADIATATGITSIVTSATSGLPALIATTNPNAYYRRVAAGAQRVDLFDGRNGDVYNNGTLRLINSLRAITDLAANETGVSTVSNGLVITSYSPDGYLRGSSTINATDARALTIRAVGDAVWVSVEAGCPACTHTTYVFDPRTRMSQTSTFPGAIVDVVSSGNRAYAITDTDIRVVNIADPFHPSTIVSAAAPQSAVSIAYANGTVYALGDKLTAYSESTLTSLGDILGSFVADPTGVYTAADQRVRIDGNCAVVVGRSFSPQLFTIASASSWAPAASFPMPSPTRSIATEPGVFQLLTEHSLETWSTTPLPKPVRR